MKEKALLLRYMDGWKKKSESDILEPISDDCLIIESHGPMYSGKETVKKWIADWFGKGNRIEKWEMKSFYLCGDHFISEWIFAYRNNEIREEFEGITIAKMKDGKIAELREYRSTAFPFSWKR
jgi:SnoaL-like protein